MKNKIKRDFTIIPNQLINDISLSRDARFLFCYLCSKPDDWKFFNSTIEKELVCSKDSRIKYTKELKVSGWITSEQGKKPDGSWGENEICLNPQPIISDTGVPRRNISATDKTGDGKIQTHNNTNLKQRITLFSKKEMSSIDVDVLKFLNEKKKSSRDFEPTSSNLKPIKARLKEKFTADDLKKVIEFKCKKWNDDSKMKSYLRPATLFGEKFNSYLIEAEQVTSSKDGSQNFEYKPQKEAKML